MMNQPVGTPTNIYYKRKTFFTILVWISTLGSIAQLIQSIGYITYNAYGTVNLVTAVFFISWNIKILKQKDFFFTGDLSKKCSPWLLLAVFHIIVGSISACLTEPIIGISYMAVAIWYVLIFLCYRYWSFFRPWKQAQQMPVYLVHHPSPMMMHQPSPMMMHQPSPMMMQHQPSPAMMSQPSPAMMQQPMQYHSGLPQYNDPPSASRKN